MYVAFCSIYLFRGVFFIIFFLSSSSPPPPLAAFQFDCDNLFNSVFRAITYFLANHSVLSTVTWVFFFPLCVLLSVYNKGEKQGIFGEKMLRYAWKQGFNPSNYTYARKALSLYTKGSRLSWMHAQFSLTFVGIIHVQWRWVYNAQSLRTLKISARPWRACADRDVLYNVRQRCRNLLFRATLQGRRDV